MPELDLVVARALHVARDRDDLRAGRVADAERAEPVGALLDDQRRVRERLDVVDQRRALVEALVRRERRLQPRVAALALEAVEQRRLLAADVGALRRGGRRGRAARWCRRSARRGSPSRRPPRPAASRMSAWSSYSPRMKMNARLAPAANAPMMMPSISRCGIFCISSRSLNVPGSDSSALQQRYLSIEPLGMNPAFLPIEKPAPPRPRRPEASSSCEHGVLCHLGQRLARRAVAARAPRRRRACASRAGRCPR